MGAGVLFVDLDGDGWPDLLFVNSKNCRGGPGGFAARLLSQQP